VGRRLWFTWRPLRHPLNNVKHWNERAFCATCDGSFHIQSNADARSIMIISLVRQLHFGPFSTQVALQFISAEFKFKHMRIHYKVKGMSRDSSVGIATGYGLDDREVGVQVQVGERIFISPRRPDRFWGPLSLLSNGYSRAMACNAWLNPRP
jgi:hypothetical protein